VTSESQNSARSVADEADPCKAPARPGNVAKKWQCHAWESKKDSGRFALSPFAVRCRRQDLNLHDLYGHQALNLARLPIPPLRLTLRQHGKRIGNQELAAYVTVRGSLLLYTSCSLPAIVCDKYEPKKGQRGLAGRKPRRRNVLLESIAREECRATRTGTPPFFCCAFMRSATGSGKHLGAWPIERCLSRIIPGCRAASRSARALRCPGLRRGRRGCHRGFRRFRRGCLHHRRSDRPTRKPWPKCPSAEE
jgi:hypothetical protein